ncbi:MAG: hypothetical protein E7553_05635 [Ruminococcaceae bacterium]|nr:hypothetical protein [Oscillospiraceae bacterium]
MKRFVAFAAAVSMLFVLTGCNSLSLWLTERDEQALEKLYQEISQTAQSAESFEITDESGNVLLTQEDLEHVEMMWQSNGDDTYPIVLLTFDRDGAEKFKNATADNMGRELKILLDDEEVFSAVVNAVIGDGQAVLSGEKIATQEQAMELAVRIESTME